MKKVLFALAFAAIAFVGCQKATEAPMAPAEQAAPAADQAAPAADQAAPAAAPAEGQAQ